jgi:hypothetical protein
MGYYTQLYINIDVIGDIPEDVKYALYAIFDSKTRIERYNNNPYVKLTEGYKEAEKIVDPKLPNHSFFKTSRWDSIASCTSYYHGGTPVSKIVYDDISKEYKITSSANFKNYENEIDKFFDWMSPYIAREGFIGSFIPESYGLSGVLAPTLVFLNHLSIVYVNIGLHVEDTDKYRLEGLDNIQEAGHYIEAKTLILSEEETDNST